MRNVEMKIDGKKLIITVDISVKGEQSSSGKSMVLGSTEGNVPVAGKPEIKVGLNVYKPV